MADNTSLQSHTKNPTSQISSFLGSPRFFHGFFTKIISDAETSSMSPTSILDTKNSSSFVNPFGCDESKNVNPPYNFCYRTEPEGIGLALIDSLSEGRNDGSFSKPINRMVLFGSKLKVHIPAVDSVSPVESPKSPADFGIKTRSSQLLSPFRRASSNEFARQLSLKEMELSEDYTCVISHGPNPKTTHIFDDCIVEICCVDDDGNFSDQEKIEIRCQSASDSVDFLSFCHICKDNLGQGKDIYIYRGEKAFCSPECRCQEITVSKGRRILSWNDGEDDAL